MSDLTTEQRQLAEFMSDLSEEGWYAGWMTGLEYALWEAVLGGGRQYGHLTLTEWNRRFAAKSLRDVDSEPPRSS